MRHDCIRRSAEHPNFFAEDENKRSSVDIFVAVQRHSIITFTSLNIDSTYYVESLYIRNSLIIIIGEKILKIRMIDDTIISSFYSKKKKRK